MDSTSELFELWFDRRGRIASFLPPAGLTERDMELMCRVTEVLPPLFVDEPTVRIQVEPNTDAESTQWLQPAWFEDRR